MLSRHRTRELNYASGLIRDTITRGVGNGLLAYVGKNAK
jgi:hypothetical protein